MSNDLKTGFQIKEGYISRRIANLNNKSENLKESRDLKMPKTMRLVENTKEEEQLYKEMKKKYIDTEQMSMEKCIKKDKEKDIKEIKQMVKAEEKEIKRLILNAKKEYGIENEVIEPLFKIISDISITVSSGCIERAMEICKVLKIRNLEDFKKNEENLKILI